METPLHAEDSPFSTLPFCPYLGVGYVYVRSCRREPETRIPDAWYGGTMPAKIYLGEVDGYGIVGSQYSHGEGISIDEIANSDLVMYLRVQLQDGSAAIVALNAEGYGGITIAGQSPNQSLPRLDMNANRRQRIGVGLQRPDTQAWKVLDMITSEPPQLDPRAAHNVVARANGGACPSSSIREEFKMGFAPFEPAGLRDPSETDPHREVALGGTEDNRGFVRVGDEFVDAGSGISALEVGGESGYSAVYMNATDDHGRPVLFKLDAEDGGALSDSMEIRGRSAGNYLQHLQAIRSDLHVGQIIMVRRHKFQIVQVTAVNPFPVSKEYVSLRELPNSPVAFDFASSVSGHVRRTRRRTTTSASSHPSVRQNAGAPSSR